MEFIARGKNAGDLGRKTEAFFSFCKVGMKRWGDTYIAGIDVGEVDDALLPQTNLLVVLFAVV